MFIKMKKCFMISVLILLTILLSSCEIKNNVKETTQTMTKTGIYEQSHKADEYNNIGSIATSGGCIAQHNYSYYFSNPDDNNKLYKMDKSFKSKKKLSDNNNSSNRLQIQFIDNTLYYLNYKGDIKDNTYVGTLYSYDLTTNTESSVSEQNICSYCVYNDFIYYSTFDEHKIYRITPNGSNIKEIYSDNSIFPQSLQVYKNKLYSCYNESLLQIDLNNLNFNSFCLYPHKFLIYNDHIYFTSDNDGLRAVDLSKIDESEKILIFDDVIDFAVFDNKLCYSTDDDKIYVSDIEGKNLKFICNGTKPIILNDILFYYDLDGLLCYTSIGNTNHTNTTGVWKTSNLKKKLPVVFDDRINFADDYRDFEKIKGKPINNVHTEEVSGTRTYVYNENIFGIDCKVEYTFGGDILQWVYCEFPVKTQDEKQEVFSKIKQKLMDFYDFSDKTLIKESVKKYTFRKFLIDQSGVDGIIELRKNSIFVHIIAINPSGSYYNTSNVG